MARSKSLAIRLDVRDFCDAASTLVTDIERAEFLFGFICGIRGTQGREDASEHFISGYTIGIEARIKVERTREACSIAGAKGQKILTERRFGAPEIASGGSPMGEGLGEGKGEGLGAPYGAPMGSPLPDTTSEGKGEGLGAPYGETYPVKNGRVGCTNLILLRDGKQPSQEDALAGGAQ